jgi:hypothetical protein
MYVICMRMCWGVASARLGTIDARNIPITPTNCCACALIDLACLKSSGARRTLPPPTTLLQSHPYAIRACNHHRITFLRKTLPGGPSPPEPPSTGSRRQKKTPWEIPGRFCGSDLVSATAQFDTAELHRTEPQLAWTRAFANRAPRLQ